MEKFQLFNFTRRTPALIRWTLRIALVVAAVSALSLLALLVWSPGNASRYAQQYNTLLIPNLIFAVAPISWLVLLAVRKRAVSGTSVSVRADPAAPPTPTPHHTTPPPPPNHHP